ncbi:uncharacterized protein [Heptranchias perlo]|uniref:uncharacterized protein n=1 Tax=Heptranchias perlo TaxID=212740 RepID=UPI003559E814
MKIAILLTYLAAIGFARPVRKARDLDSNSDERFSRYYQRFNPFIYSPFGPFRPTYHMRPFYPNYGYYPNQPYYPGYNYPHFNYPNYARMPMFNGYATSDDPKPSTVKGVNYVGENAPPDHSVNRKSSAHSVSSELSLEDTSSMEDTDFRVLFENVPYGEPDYEVPVVPDYEVPVVPDYEVPVVPDYEVPAVPGVDTNAVDVGFDQKNSEELATEVSNAEEPASVLPYSDSLQSSDSLGVNLEGDSTIRESNERISYQEVIYKPTGLDLKNDETLNNEESVDQQVSYENSDEDDPTEENETQNININAVDMDSIALSNDDDDNDRTESNINGADYNDGNVVASMEDANYDGADSNEDDSNKTNAEIDNKVKDIDPNFPF